MFFYLSNAFFRYAIPRKIPKKKHIHIGMSTIAFAAASPKKIKLAQTIDNKKKNMLIKMFLVLLFIYNTSVFIIFTEALAPILSAPASIIFIVV